MVSVIIPTNRRPRQLEALLRSLLGQSYPLEKYEVLVIDNFFDYSTKRVVDQFEDRFGHCRYFWSDRLGVNIARNLGVSHAQGDYLVFLDDDCLLHDRQYLQKVVNLHKEHVRASVIGGRYDLVKPYSIAQAAYHVSAETWLTVNRIDRLRTNQLIGGNISFKSGVLLNRLKYNENICFGGSEAELNFRLIKEGHELILSDSLLVRHDCKVSPYSMAKKGYLQGFFEGKYIGSSGVGRRDRGSSDFRVIQAKHIGDLQMGFLHGWLIHILLFLQSMSFYLGLRHAARDQKGLMAVLASVVEVPVFVLDRIFESCWFNGMRRSSRILFDWLRVQLARPYHWLHGHIWKLWLIPFHFFRRAVWPFLVALTAPYHWVRKHLWRLWSTPYHFFRQNIWPILIQVMTPLHWLHGHIWKLWLIPFHFFRRTVWPLLVAATAPYHWLRKHLWRLWSTPYHFCRQSIWPILIQIMAPFHWLHRHAWRLWCIPYHFFRRKIWPILISGMAPYHWLRCHIWRFWHYPYHFLWRHWWRLKLVILLPYYFFKRHLWRVKLVSVVLFVPYHWVRNHAWKIKIPFWALIKFVGVFIKPKSIDEQTTSYWSVVRWRWNQYCLYLREVFLKTREASPRATSEAR